MVLRKMASSRAGIALSPSQATLSYDIVAFSRFHVRPYPALKMYLIGRAAGLSTLPRL